MLLSKDYVMCSKLVRNWLTIVRVGGPGRGRSSASDRRVLPAACPAYTHHAHGDAVGIAGSGHATLAGPPDAQYYSKLTFTTGRGYASLTAV